MIRITVTIWSLCLLLAGCGGGGGGGKKGPSPPPPPPPPVSGCYDAVEFCGTIPGNADTCTDPQYWPLNVSSTIYPVTVHFPRLDDEPTALELLNLLDESWAVQIDTIGFTAPLDDGGGCGPDGNFDVFMWPGIDGAYVSGVSDVPGTPHDDYATFMAFDTSGSIAPRFFDTYIAHELNHALQASDDWWEDAVHYESGATFAEWLVYPDQSDSVFTFEDFQANPGWSLFYNDNFATWYMYGASMYLHFLFERHYAGDPAFYQRIWFATRSPPRGMRPDYLDALRAVLGVERGVSLDDSVLEFSQWRWFIDSFDDGAHFADGANWRYPVAYSEVDVADLPTELPVTAMLYGANYVRVTNNSGAPVDVSALLDQGDPALDWRLLEVEAGSVAAPLTIPDGGAIVLAAVLLPADEVWTDTLSFDEHSVDLAIDIQ